MARIKKQDGVELSITEETVKGTPEAVSASDFVEAVDSITINNPIDKVDLPVMCGSRMKKKSVKTIQRGDGQTNVHMRAGENEGDEPETDVLIRSQGWTKEALTSRVSSTGTNTTTTFNVTAGDELLFKVGQMIAIEDTVNGDSIVVVSALASGVITFEPALSVAPDDSAQIKESINYRLDGKEDTSFTARKWFNRVQKQEVPYCKVSNMAIGPITAGQPAQMDFTFAGVNFTESQEVLGVTPSCDNTEVPYAVDACLYKDGVAVEASEITIEVENALSTIELLCAQNGLAAQEAASTINVSGSCTVYKDDLTTDFLQSDSKYSLHLSIYVKNGDRKENIVGIHLPVVKTDERDTNGDINGFIVMAISFSAEPSENEEDFPVIMFS